MAAPADSTQTVDKKGAYKRKPSTYLNWISSSPDAKFQPEANRYVLYVSYACPWACRCLTVLYAKKLEKIIDVVVVHPLFLPTNPSVDQHRGWVFDKEFDGKVYSDPVRNSKSIREIYETTVPAGGELPVVRSVPILYDRKTQQIVNNESSLIIQILNNQFNDYCETEEARKIDFFPEELKEEIERLNEWTYESINNGVYKCGFARSQEAYEDAANVLFNRLEEVDLLLDKKRYLTGDRITLSDIRLVQTFVRFDTVYVVHFKTSKKCLREFKNLHNYMLDVVQACDMERGAINMSHIQHHYFRSHTSVNPFGIVAQMPQINFKAPHGRG